MISAKYIFTSINNVLIKPNIFRFQAFISNTGKSTFVELVYLFKQPKLKSNTQMSDFMYNK